MRKKLKSAENMLILSQICNIYSLWKRSRAAQVPLAGHMQPAGRVFETAGLEDWRRAAHDPWQPWWGNMGQKRAAPLGYN
jgi:hypothetical protein